MGAIAEIIKAAEEKRAVDPSAVIDQINAMQSQLSKDQSEPDALKELSAKVPTAKEESASRAKKYIAATALTMLGIGAALRLMRARKEGKSRKRLIEGGGVYAGIPGREITVPLPHMKRSSANDGLSKDAGFVLPAALAALTIPPALRAAGSSVGSAWEGAKRKVSHGFETLFTPTGSALDNPWFLAGAIAAGLGGGYLGYSQLDKYLESRREGRAQREIDKARKEFEDALRAQYRESELLEQSGKGKRALPATGGSFKFSSAGMMGVVADAFAQAHVSGELNAQLASIEKQAADEESAGDRIFQWKGAGNKSLGVYLAALALLTAAGAYGGYSFVKSRERPRIKHQLAKEYLRRRSLATPPTVSVETA